MKTGLIGLILLGLSVLPSANIHAGEQKISYKDIPILIPEQKVFSQYMGEGYLAEGDDTTGDGFSKLRLMYFPVIKEGDVYTGPKKPIMVGFDFDDNKKLTDEEVIEIDYTENTPSKGKDFFRIKKVI